MTVKSQTLSPEDTEKLLLAKFGTKLEPVDKTKLAKLKQQQSRANMLKFKGQKKAAPE